MAGRLALRHVAHLDTCGGWWIGLVHFDSAKHLAESIYASGDDKNIARELMRDGREHLAKGIDWYLENGSFARQHPCQHRRRIY